MTRRIATDARVWAPFAVAAIWFALRWQPLPERPPPPRTHAMELPAPPAAPARKSRTEWVVDEGKSTVRFLVEGDDGELLTACTHVQGHLRLDPKNDAGELELVLDLGSLRVVDEAPSSIDLQRLLGVHNGSRVHYRAVSVRSSSTDLPGVGERLWLGSLRLGSRVVRQGMQTWQCALPGQPLRMQGHGAVQTADYGLPRRTWLGLLEEHHVVTLGLDLAWRRSDAR